MKAIFVAIALVLSVTAHAASFGELRSEANAAIEMIKSVDHYTRELGWTRLAPVMKEL
jgi:hypothetical protein